ncbi:hypothetical protein D3C78_692390 [compost metagenome]
MQAAEVAARDDIIAAHHVQQARDTGLRSQARGQGVDEGAADKDRLEQLATDIQSNFRQGGFVILEAVHGREKRLDVERHDDEHQAADQRDEEDRPRDDLLGILGFLRQSGDRVEAQEREAQNGGASDQGVEVGVCTGKRQQAPGRAQAFAAVQAAYGQVDEHADNDRLDGHEQGVEVGHQVDATDVDQAHDRHEADHPGPGRYFREHHREVEFGQQGVDHRQQQVVEQ